MAQKIRPRPEATGPKLEPKPAKASKAGPNPGTASKGIPLNKLSVRLLCIGIPLLAWSSIGIYKRVVLGQEKKKQVGEFTFGEGVQLFDEQEAARRERETLSWRLFGPERRLNFGWFGKGGSS